MTDDVGIKIGATDFFSSVFDTLNTGLGSIALSILAVNQAAALAQKVLSVAFAVPEAILEATDTVVRLQIALENLGYSARGAQSQMDQLFSLAEASPFKLESVTRSFQRLSAAGDLIKDVNLTVRALTDAVAAFGGTDQNFKLAALAIEEMAGIGTVSLRQLRRQLALEIPQAAELMAKGLGISLHELYAEAAKGQLDAKEGIQAFSVEAEKAFGGAAARMLETYGGSVNQLSVEWTLLLAALGETGFYDLAVSGVHALTLAVEGLREAVEFTKKAWMFLRGIMEHNTTHSATRPDIGANPTIQEAVSPWTKEQAIAWADIVMKIQSYNEAMKRADSVTKMFIEGTATGLHEESNAIGKLLIQEDAEIENTITEAGKLMAKQYKEFFEKQKEELKELIKSWTELAQLTGASQVTGVSGAISGYQSAVSGGALAGMGGFQGALIGALSAILLAQPQVQAAITQLNALIGTALVPVIQAYAPIANEIFHILTVLSPLLTAILAIEALQLTWYAVTWVAGVVSMLLGMSANTLALWANTSMQGNGVGAIIVALAAFVYYGDQISAALQRVSDAFSTALSHLAAALAIPFNILAHALDRLATAIENFSFGGSSVGDWLDNALGLGGDSPKRSGNWAPPTVPSSGGGGEGPSGGGGGGGVSTGASTGRAVPMGTSSAPRAPGSVTVIQNIPSGDPRIIEEVTRRVLDRLLLQRKLGLI